MSNIVKLDFSEQDIKVLKNISIKELNEQIDFLKSYREVLWSSSEYPEPMTLYELRNKKIRVQLLPVYPEEFIKIGLFYNRLITHNRISVNLHDEGFFTEGSDASLGVGTLFSPSLIAMRISDAFYRDRFCDGLFGDGVEDDLYLKMILHLLDCKIYYERCKGPIRRQIHKRISDKK